MSLNIYTSNRMEKLAATLAGLLAKPLTDPLAPEHIVVQSRGMQRWLTMELARCFGVCANLHCPFPNAFVAELFRCFLPEAAVDVDHYSREQLTWRILKILPDFIAKDIAAPLANYCSNDNDGTASLQLAGRIADTFDQYSLFRPQMLQKWADNKSLPVDEQWQAALWQTILAETSGNHRARLLELFRQQFLQAKAAPPGLPERVAIFGISYLPPYHLAVFEALSRFVDINIFLLSPTREYWADIAPRRQQQLSLMFSDDSLITEGNPLLASLGRQGRDFSALILDLDVQTVHQDELYHEPGDDSLLHCMQSDILNLRGADEAEKLPLATDDCSIMINSCHSPMREIEVLHDNLLAMLDADESLAFRDIIVMAPDIELYAPFITAIFDSNHGTDRYIPYSIADRRLVNEGEVSQVILKLLELPGSRLGAVQLLDILAVPLVYRHFGLSEDDIPIIRSWLETSGIRWGLDEHDRQQRGLPAFRNNSWYAGLERMLLGLAMPDDGELFAGILPFDAMEGTVTAVLGSLADFVKAVEWAVTRLSQKQTLESWHSLLLDLLKKFLPETDETARERKIIIDIANELQELSKQTGFAEPVTPAQFCDWCTGRMQQQEQGQGFITGGVTFCAMLPMRSIPFKSVCLIGMNDGDFPRRNLAAGFDLIQQHPKPGDRSLRDEDRYLFLEALLSARDHLYISYVGQSIRDNSDIPPSVLVSELLDAVSRRFVTADGKTVKARLVVRHPLQPFSPAYFTSEPDSLLFSYATENCSHLQKKPEPAALFFAGKPLPDTEIFGNTLQLDNLIRFFKNPCRTFMEQRLDIRMPRQQAVLEELEPLGLDGLESYQIRHRLLDELLAGNNPQKQLPLLHGAGLLPPGNHGELLFASELRVATDFAEQLEKLLHGHRELKPLDFELEINGIIISGSLKRIYDHKMLHYRCAKVKASDLLAAWLEHLLLNCLLDADYPAATALIQLDAAKEFQPLASAAEAKELLSTLVLLYQDGLNAPLPFFPETSFAWAESQDMKKLLAKWEDGFNHSGEKNDYYFQRCFNGRDPFDERFFKLAELVFNPLLNCLGTK